MFKLSPTLTLRTQDLTDHTRSRLEYVCAPATATSPSATSTMRRRHQYDARANELKVEGVSMRYCKGQRCVLFSSRFFAWRLM